MALQFVQPLPQVNTRLSWLHGPENEHVTILANLYSIRCEMELSGQEYPLASAP